MKVTYLYHSGYLVETQQYFLLFDCIDLSQVQWNPRKPWFVFVSHHHQDHFLPEVLGLDATIVVGYDVPVKTPSESIFSMKPHDVLKWDLLEVKALGSTDEGISFLIQVDQRVLFYAGDLNNWHWKLESTPQEIATMNQQYLEIINDLQGQSIDVLFYPLDPRLQVEIDLGLIQLLEIVEVNRIFPLHFSSDLAGIVRYYERSPLSDKIVKIIHRNTEIDLKGI